MRHIHGSIRVLIQLQNWNEHARAGKHRIVQRPRNVNFSIGVAVAQIQAATLKITKTAGGMRLAPFAAWNAVGANIAAAWHPTFNINHVLVLHTKVAGATLQQAIRQRQALQNHFHCFQHVLMPAATFSVVGATNDNLFNLVKLMNAIQACGVLARRAGLAAKASALRGVLQRQLLNRNNFVGVKAHQANFTGARKK